MVVVLVFIRPIGAREITGARARPAISRATTASFSSAIAAVSGERTGGWVSEGWAGEEWAAEGAGEGAGGMSFLSSGRITKVARDCADAGKGPGSLTVAVVVAVAAEVVSEAFAVVIVAAAVVDFRVRKSKNRFFLDTSAVGAGAGAGTGMGGAVSVAKGTEMGSDKGLDKGSDKHTEGVATCSIAGMPTWASRVRAG